MNFCPSIQCCQEANISDFKFSCCKSDKSNLRDNKSEVLYYNEEEQILIMPTPSMNINEYIPLPDLPKTVIHEVIEIKDLETGDSRLVTACIQGPYMNWLVPEKQHNENIIGADVSLIFKKSILEILIPIFRATLKRNFIQVIISWNNDKKLLRSFPIMSNRKRNILAAKIVISPFHNRFNEDIENFILNEEDTFRKRQKRLPLKQVKYSTLRLSQNQGIVPNDFKTPRRQEMKI